MITGDHLLIAIETASRLGMGTPAELFFYGPEFFRAVDAGWLTFEGVDVRDIVHSADGFAGVTPKHKYFIVDQLQKFNGARHLVGMTGDGVNDAPALFKADVGIAVHGATDAAKAAADLVLLAPGDPRDWRGGGHGAVRVRERVLSYLTYRVSATFEFLVYFLVAIALMEVSVPAIGLVAITLLNDFVSVAVAYDSTNPVPRPARWNLKRMAGLAVVLGFIATAGVVGAILMWERVSQEAPTSVLPTPAPVMMMATSPAETTTTAGGSTGAPSMMGMLTQEGAGAPGAAANAVGFGRALHGTNLFGVHFDPRCF